MAAKETTCRGQQLLDIATCSNLKLNHASTWLLVTGSTFVVFEWNVATDDDQYWTGGLGPARYLRVAWGCSPLLQLESALFVRLQGAQTPKTRVSSVYVSCKLLCSTARD